MIHYAEADANSVVLQCLHVEDGDDSPTPSEGCTVHRLAEPVDWALAGAGISLRMADGAAVWTDVRTIDDAKAQAWSRIKAAREAAEHGPFECDGRTYDADEKATGRITGATNGAMMAAMAGAPFSIDFTLSDNSVATLSGAEMMAVGAALIAKVGAVFDTGRALRESIEAATTNAEADAIHWPE